VLSNFAVFVQKANTLKPIGDLANQLTSNIEGENRKIQKLLDFVTGQIEYDERELRFQRQVLKRPLDTLLARQGTCGSKTVLFASLLEQVGHPDYVIVHYPKHVTVFVPGEGKNGYNLSLGGKTYTLAEATCEGFVIGQSRLETTLGKPTFFAFPSKGFGMYPDGRKMIF